MATRHLFDDEVVGLVAALRRFPVKSTAGEFLSRAAVGARGLMDDREWAAYTLDGGIASGKTTRRFRKVEGLLQWRSSAGTSGGPPELHGPDGRSYVVDDPLASRALSRALGQPLRLGLEGEVRHHDECGVHLVTTASIHGAEQLIGGRLDARRLRANIVLQTDGTGFVEDAWSGAELAIGAQVVLRLGSGMPRCRMVDQPQRDVPAAPPLLRALGHRGVLLGLQAEVVRTGNISVGDQARLVRGQLDEQR